MASLVLEGAMKEHTALLPAGFKYEPNLLDSATEQALLAEIKG